MKYDFDDAFKDDGWEYSQSSHYQRKHGGPRNTFVHIADSYEEKGYEKGNIDGYAKGYEEGLTNGRNDAYQNCIKVAIGFALALLFIFYKTIPFVFCKIKNVFSKIKEKIVSLFTTLK